DLLTNPRVLADLDRLAGHVAHDPDARVPADLDPPALHHGEETDLHVVSDLHDLPDHDAPEAEAHAAADAVPEQQAIGEDFQRARQPTEQGQVAPRDAVLRDQGLGHGAYKIRPRVTASRARCCWGSDFAPWGLETRPDHPPGLALGNRTGSQCGRRCGRAAARTHTPSRT